MLFFKGIFKSIISEFLSVNLRRKLMLSLREQQQELEHRGITEGILRFQNALKKTNFTETQVGLSVFNKAILRFSKALEESCIVSTRSDSCSQLTLKTLETLRETISISSPLELAFCLSKSILDLSFSSLIDSSREPYGNYKTILSILSKEYQKHHNWCLFKNSENFKKTEKHLKYCSDSLIHREKVITLSLSNTKGLPYLDLEDLPKLYLSVRILECFIESTGLVYLTYLPHPKKKGRGPKHVLPHPDILKYTQDSNLRLQLMTPICFPMLIPAEPWVSSLEGAYVTNDGTPKGLSLRFIRSSKATNKIAETSINFNRVTKVADILGQVPFRINKRVHEIAQELLKSSSNAFPDLIPPRVEDLDLPIKPWGSQEAFDVLKREKPEIVRDWKRKAAVEYDRILGKSTVSKRIKMNRQLLVSDSLRERPSIYFPHSVDFRGRYYPMPPWVNPQADDFGLSLLEFAKGDTLTDSNFAWYLIHGANLYGWDKLPYDARIKNIQGMSADILKISQDPIGNAPLWTCADKGDAAWEFLSWALEYAEVLKGNTKEVHQIILMDGTCNGLQHYAALLRDPIGGSKVNLSPSEIPSDVYKDVAEETLRLLALEGSEDALYWLKPGLISRKVVKRNTMTTPYGVTRFGMKEQLNKELADIKGIPDDFRRHTLFLSRIIYEALGSCVKSAQEGMGWLHKVASCYLENDLEVTWVTPLGLLARQEYHKFTSVPLQLRIGKRKVNLMNVEDTFKQDKQKNILAFAPNFIHSLDASHLGFTVLEMHKQGISNFSMIHDSYGTSVSHVANMQRILREQFVRLYTEFKPLEALKESFERRCPGEVLQELPQMGTLDLTQVLNSKYFFM